MKKTSKRYLAVDLGAGSGRVMMAQFDGRRLSLEAIARFENNPVEMAEHLHWNTTGLLAHIREGLARAAAQYSGITSVGVDTWGVDYGLLDKTGRLLGLPYIYRDIRTDGMIAKACRLAGRRAIYDATGIQFMFFNTLFQLLAEARHPASLLEHADRLLFMPDLVNYWLSGVKAVEATIASTSQLIDPRTGDWRRPLIKKLGFPSRIFATPTPPATRLGPVRTVPGLEKAQMVTVGSHDTASAVAGAPAQAGTAYAYISSGTWSLMGMELRQPVITDRSFAYGFTNEGGIGRTIRLLKNLTGTWLIQECRRAWQQAGHAYSYAELARIARRAPAFQHFIDPDHPDFTKPGHMPDKIAAYAKRTGQPALADPAAYMRATREALAMKYRQVLGELEDLTGRRMDVIHIVGGGSQDGFLCQAAANAMHRTVTAGPVEATTLGNILAQMLAAGDIASLAQGRQIIRDSFPVRTYQPRQTGAWDEAYARWRMFTARG